MGVLAVTIEQNSGFQALLQSSTVTEQMGCFKKHAVSHWASESPSRKHLIAIDSSGQLSLCNNDRISKNYWIFYVLRTTAPNWSMVSMKSFLSITKTNIRDYRDQCFDQWVVNFARGEKGNQDYRKAQKMLIYFKGNKTLLFLSCCPSRWWYSPVVFATYSGRLETEPSLSYWVLHFKGNYYLGKTMGCLWLLVRKIFSLHNVNCTHLWFPMLS